MPDTAEETEPDKAADEVEATHGDEGTGTASRLALLERFAGLPQRRLLVVAVAVVVALVAGGAWWMNRGLPDDVAVRVGDTDVTESELRQRMTTIEALYGVQVPSDPDKRDEFWRDAAQSVAMSHVIANAAEVDEVEISEGEVDRSLDTFVATAFGAGQEGWSGFTKALGNLGASEADVREEMRRQLELTALFAKITGDVAVPTDPEVKEAYADRKCSLTIPEGRQISNIVVPTKPEAKQTLQRLRSGADFSALAAEVSIDGSTRDQGGDLGVVRASDLTGAYAKAAFKADEGNAFGPVRSEHGWNVGLVTAVEPERTPRLGEIRDQLRQTLLTEAQSVTWRSWLREKVGEAEIEYDDGYRPDDPLALPNDSIPESADEGPVTEKEC